MTFTFTFTQIQHQQQQRRTFRFFALVPGNATKFHKHNENIFKLNFKETKIQAKATATSKTKTKPSCHASNTRHNIVVVAANRTAVAAACVAVLVMGLLEFSQCTDERMASQPALTLSMGRCGNLKAKFSALTSSAQRPEGRLYDDNAFAVIIISQTQTMNFIIFPSIYTATVRGTGRALNV